MQISPEELAPPKVPKGWEAPTAGAGLPPKSPPPGRLKVEAAEEAPNPAQGMQELMAGDQV